MQKVAKRFEWEFHKELTWLINTQKDRPFPTLKKLTKKMKV